MNALTFHIKEDTCELYNFIFLLFATVHIISPRVFKIPHNHISQMSP